MKLNNGKCYLPITFVIQFLGVILYAPNAVPPMAARMSMISIYPIAGATSATSVVSAEAKSSGKL